MMFPEISALFTFIVTESERRSGAIQIEAWGRERVFVAYDYGDDTFIFEDGIWDRLDNKDPFIIVPKADLLPQPESGEAPRVYGNVLALSTGNHAVTSMPLLMGKFWDLSSLKPEVLSSVLRSAVVCGNCVEDAFEISQRDVSTERVMEVDNWLQGLGCSMNQIILVDRTDTTLSEYRQLGQEWRIKQLAWTHEEMSTAIRASQSRIHAGVRYYHNVKGVHFLTYRQFAALGEELRRDPAKFTQCLDELARPSQDDGVSFLRRPRCGSHHEIELFGLLPGISETQLVPAIEALQKAAPSLSPEELASRFAAIVEHFRSRLLSDELADEESPSFVETLYYHITGEVYLGAHDGIAPTFDDRRTALPGVTYLYDTRYMHPGADGRTEAILDYLESNVSHGDRIEHVNVYEIRSESESVRVGEGKTRDIVYKTASQPLPLRLIEKRLAQKSTGYGNYTIARVQAFRSLGVSYGPHRLLARADGVSGDVHFFVRERYPGEAFNALPPASFHRHDVPVGAGEAEDEDPDIVTEIMALMGEAAAENLILKKMTPDTGSIRYAEGKEIIEFGYNSRLGKEMPVRVWLCSVRGTMGWPEFDCTHKNLDKAFHHYMAAFAKTIVNYAEKHPSVTLDALAVAFKRGFQAKTNEIFWNYRARREMYDAYNPSLFGDYQFPQRWRFVLWSLEQQRLHLDKLEKLLDAKIRERQN